MGGKEIKIKPLPHIKPLPREPDFDEKRAEFNDTWYFLVGACPCRQMQ